VSPSDDDAAAKDAESPDEETKPADKPADGRNKVLIFSVAAVVVLVVAGIVVYLLTSGDSENQADKPKDVPTITGSAAPTTTKTTTTGASVAPPATATGVTGAPEDVQDAGSIAEEVATAISGADVSTLNELSCDPGSAGTEESFPADAKAEVVGEPKVTGDTATVDLKLTIGENEPATVPMPLTKKDGRWCIP
jgi:hypothetical protein